MKKFFHELVSSKADGGKISHTKFWGNVGMLAMTAVFCYGGYKGTLTWDIYIIYAVTVTQPSLLSKYLSLKFLSPQQNYGQMNNHESQGNFIPQHQTKNNLVAPQPIPVIQPINSNNELNTGVQT